jgi:UDP-glucose 4-epimerase
LAAIAEKPLGFVYAGSSTAYGNRWNPQHENDLPDVQSPYSATKLAGELLVRSFVVTFGIQATVLRYFQVYGPGQPTTGAYALVTGIFLRQFASGEPLTIEGDGNQSRDFIHVTDVARANVLALEVDSQGLPINIGSGQPKSIKWLADFISPNQVHLPPRRIDLAATCANITRAKTCLGWEPTIPVRRGLAEMIGEVLHARHSL